MTLAIADRCDRCRAQAFAILVKNGVQRLLLCDHHRRKHEAAIVAQGFVLVDESYRINLRPTESGTS